jgi:hypothetical protein
VLWSAIGITIYFVYGYRNSRLRGPEKPGHARPVAADIVREGRP